MVIPSLQNIQSGVLILKRSNRDVFTNNFNTNLIDIHRANLDIQYITDEYSVAEYISGYCTKTDGGTTSLLKKINEEATGLNKTNNGIFIKTVEK